jgi:hypothetical protein
LQPFYSDVIVSRESQGATPGIQNQPQHAAFHLGDGPPARLAQTDVKLAGRPNFQAGLLVGR